MILLPAFTSLLFFALMMGREGDAGAKPQQHNHNNNNNNHHLLFVYGTLKRGFFNHETYLSQGEASGTAEYLGTAQTMDKFRLEIVGARKIPALIDDSDDVSASLSAEHEPSSSCQIQGEVFSINNQALQAMDLLEGVATGRYYRVQRNVEWVQRKGQEESSNDNDNNTQQAVPCWIYLQREQQKDGNDNNNLAHDEPFSSYTPELHRLYIPPTTQPDVEILRLLRLIG